MQFCKDLNWSKNQVAYLIKYHTEKETDKPKEFIEKMTEAEAKGFLKFLKENYQVPPKTKEESTKKQPKAAKQDPGKKADKDPADKEPYEGKSPIVIVPRGEVEFPKITTEDVRRFICENATDNEIALFIKVAEMNKLNPFKREIYLVKYGNYPASILTGYEVYLKRAERNGNYAGFKVWIEGEGDNMKAKIVVPRKDWDEPLEHEVDYKEYVQVKGDGTVNKFWKGKPKTMLKKVAISQGVRFAFPSEVAGLPHTREESDGSIIDGEVTESSGKPDVAMPEPKIETEKK